MGTWSIMPLLSTLAALIIIVHSMEESVEDHHRHRLSPRISNNGASEFDQWRIVEVEPMMQEPAPIIWPETAPSKSPSRVRRPGRKRKRRLHSEEGDSIHEDRIKHEHDVEEPRQSYRESESQVVYETTELPRRRRKRPEMRNNPWEDEVLDVHRPTRRRGQRRRRPQNRDNEDDLSVIDHRPIQSDEQKSEEHRWNNPNEERRYRLRPTEPKVHRIYFEDDNRPIRKHRIIPDDRIFDTHEEKRSSESEEIQPRNMLDITATTSSTTEPSNPENSVGIDALSLKELLKRSDGASLSEILQRRNLSLADLLSGRENALSALQTDYNIDENQDNAKVKETDNSVEKYRETESKEYINVTPTEEPVFTPMSEEVVATKFDDLPALEIKEKEHALIINKEDIEENTPRISTRRRIPSGSRKRLRIKNSQTNVDNTPTVDIAAHNPRRTVKKMLAIPSAHVNVLISEKNNTKDEIDEKLMTTILSTTIEDTTEYIDTTPTSDTPMPIEISTTTEEIVQNITYSTKATTKSATITSSREEKFPDPPLEDLLTEKSESPVALKRSKILSIPDLELRRQVLANRLKKKRMRQKNTEQDLPHEDVKDLFGMANLVSASEFIAKIQSPDTPIASTASDNHEQFISTLQDVTMPDDTIEKDVKPTKPTLPSTERSTTKMSLSPVTEEAAQKEIEEILNDFNTGARLSKILSERNMTVNELVEHRERGSSQVHLADIFHNASMEPNPPEPFLSKSLIEPISKETYPLRALLEANQHEPAVKLQTPDTNGRQFGNIPIAMDFGNNVNENGENLGIVSLFNKINKSIDITKNKIQKDAEGATYFTSVSPDNTSNYVRGQGADDMQLIALKEIFTNSTITNKDHLDKHETTEGTTTTEIQSTIDTNDDNLNREDLILLENLNMNDFSNKIAITSDEELEVSNEDKATEEALDSLPNNAKSVTIATAAIAGLTMLLFLLTYIGCKWKNQRNVVSNRDTTSEERIQTPVFESRKFSKINSSSRSISPMLSNSNIYTMSTLDSRNGKESPEYMWDSLRKPFQ